jgi:hypothetical protein
MIITLFFIIATVAILPFAISAIKKGVFATTDFLEKEAEEKQRKVEEEKQQKLLRRIAVIKEAEKVGSNFQELRQLIAFLQEESEKSFKEYKKYSNASFYFLILLVILIFFPIGLIILAFINALFNFAIFLPEFIGVTIFIAGYALPIFFCIRKIIRLKKREKENITEAHKYEDMLEQLKGKFGDLDEILVPVT